MSNATLLQTFEQHFFPAYLNAALNNTTIQQDEEGALLSAEAIAREGDVFGAHFSIADFHPDTLAVLRAHALSFWYCAAAYAEKACTYPGGNYTIADVSEAFWIVHNASWQGFWNCPVFGNELAVLATHYPETELGLDENDKIIIR